MTLVDGLVLGVASLLWGLALFQAVPSLTSGIRFYRYMKAAAGSPTATHYQPRVTVIMPCCGLDLRLAATVEALRAQAYPDFSVIFTFESTHDPAYAAVGRLIAAWTDRPARRVVAGPAEARSQKVHNLLAAVSAADPSAEVLVFVDSDVVPHANWLRELVAPLADPAIGATTGFRWYSARGGWLAGIWSAWNAATVSFLHDDRYNFTWGGSTALRRSTFEKCQIVGRWQGALSDDYQVTRAIRESGLAIRFVPRCLVACDEPTSLMRFLSFARRQLIITRICAPHLWRAGMTLAANFVGGATATFVLMVVAWLRGDRGVAAVAGVAWIILLILAKLKAALRQAGVALVLRPPQWTWRDWMHDVAASELQGVLHLALLLSSIGTRCFAWRNRTYEMVSADETRILRREPPLADSARVPGPAAP